MVVDVDVEVEVEVEVEREVQVEVEVEVFRCTSETISRCTSETFLRCTSEAHAWYRWPIEIDGLPINSMVIVHGELLSSQRVI